MEAAFAAHSEKDGARMQAMIARLASGARDEMADTSASFATAVQCAGSS